MTSCLIAAITGMMLCGTPSPSQQSTMPPDEPVLVGYASQYNIGVMPQVMANRIAWGHVDADTVSMYGDRIIAVYHCRHLYKEAVMKLAGDVIDVLVGDCAGGDTEARDLFNAGVVLEVSGELAERYDFYGRGGVVAEVVID